MAGNAYQLWLKKREFKSPRAPPSPASLSTTDVCLADSKVAARNVPMQDALNPARSISAKFHAVSGVETTHVAVQSVTRPPVARKRPRSWLGGLQHTAGKDRTAQDAKVAGRAQDAGCLDKVAGLKRLRGDKEAVMKATTLKLASAAKVLRQSSSKRDLERAVWSGRIDEEKKDASVGRGEGDDVKPATRVKSSFARLTQVGKRPINESGNRTTKRLRFDAATKGGASVVVNGVQRKTSELEKTLTRKKRAPEESGDRTTKRLRFDEDGGEGGAGGDETGTVSGLPPKSPQRKKQRRISTAMLDESQYWMAVDRFSHLS